MTPKEYVKRHSEIMQAQREYPTMEIGAAYTKWKSERGEQAAMISFNEDIPSKREIYRILSKPCSQNGCKGNQILETICGTCVEGRKGYKTKWTCEECLHRELSRKEYSEWLTELSHS